MRLGLVPKVTSWCQNGISQNHKITVNYDAPFSDKTFIENKKYPEFWKFAWLENISYLKTKF